MHQMRVALFFLAAGVASVSGAPSAQSPAASAAYDLLLKERMSSTAGTT
jgi:hypothetical protein